jgi:hypothetical protein
MTSDDQKYFCSATMNTTIIQEFQRDVAGDSIFNKATGPRLAACIDEVESDVINIHELIIIIIK